MRQSLKELTINMQRLYENIFYSEKVNKLFTGDALIGYMLQFEASLSGAQAMHNVIPVSAGKIIAACCKAENINKEQLIADAGSGGNIIIPLVKQLTAVVKQKDNEAAKYVHFGATSQDVGDTATSLQLRDALQLINNDMQQLILQLIYLTETHRHTIMIGRSFMQHARPVTFGFKVAGWLDSLLRSKKRVEKILAEDLVIQLGGAVGSLSAMEDKGLQVIESMCAGLQLNMPGINWHTQRDRFAETAATLGILTGNVGKIAADISLLMQTEIAEVFEPSTAGNGASSTLPHKRNPVGCIAILANTRRVPALVSTMLSCMVQDHERSTGDWHAEWETLADIVQLTAGAVFQACIVTNGLETDTAQMAANMEITNGLIYAENISLALAQHLGKEEAHALTAGICKDATKQKVHLKSLVQKNDIINKYFSQAQLNDLFDPAKSTGLCDIFIDRVLHMAK